MQSARFPGFCMMDLRQHGNFEALRVNLRAFEREQKLSSCLQALENAFRAVPFLAPPTVLTGAQHAELYYSLQRSCAKAVDLIGWSNGVLRTEGGFAGAFGLVRVWAKPFDQRRQYVDDIWMWLECAGSFRDEVANMRGAAQVAEAYRLPNGCTVIPFSGQTQKPEVVYAEL